MNEGVNLLARVLEERSEDYSDKPILDFGEIQNDMSLLLNKFPVPIPYSDYVICRSVCYDPEIPLSMTWWRDEGWNRQTASETDWESIGQKQQPQQFTRNGQPVGNRNRWGELINPTTGVPYWIEKHNNHIHSSKGEHDHGEDPDGKHYHDVYLPRKMYRIQPGDRVLVAWVGDDAVVIDIIMKATVMM
jgi:hypothetical protein